MKRNAAMLMSMFLFATCAMRVEAAVTFELPESEEQSNVIIQMDHTDFRGYADDEEDGDVVILNYIVTTENETIESISKRLRVTEEYLLSVNPDYELENHEIIPKFTYVQLPEIYWSDVECVYYFVEKGDCLLEISDYFNTTVLDIQDLNPTIENPDLIYAGELLKVK